MSCATSHTITGRTHMQVFCSVTLSLTPRFVCVRARRELPVQVRALLGNTHPEGFLHYFCGLFPGLFLSCFEYIATSSHRTEPVFERYV